MRNYESYYLEKLYPLQDGIVKIINTLHTRFYLTGGTALSRGYFNHRYSDDLDFFVNAEPIFYDEVKLIINKLDNFNNDFIVLKDNSIITKDYFQFHIKKDDLILKIEFINDIEKRFGDIISESKLGRIDSLENILTNKITALYRYEPKDIVDIWVIANNFKFNWEDVIEKAKSKEIGVEPVIISEIISSFPKDKLNYIKWTKDMDFDQILSDLKRITFDILESKINSLF